MIKRMFSLLPFVVGYVAAADNHCEVTLEQSEETNLNLKDFKLQLYTIPTGK